LYFFLFKFSRYKILFYLYVELINFKDIENEDNVSKEVLNFENKSNQFKKTIDEECLDNIHDLLN